MMKKYLMTAIAAVAMGAAFTSCSHSDELYTQPEDNGWKEEVKKAEFASVFETKFGTPAANHSWGFVDAKVPTGVPAPSAGTRGHNVNRNEWGTGNGVGGYVSVPKNVNDPSVNANEHKLVYDYFNQKREGATNEYNVNWTDYFITEVWKGETTYKDGFGGDVKGSDKMNHLQVRYGEGSIDAEGNLVGSWEHANDFNNGDHNSGYDNIEGHTFMNNSGTLDFAYHNATDSKYHNEYIIIPGSVIDPSLSDYYYIGFDFYATHPTGQEANKNMDVERDWVFTDWIVRISPGVYTNAQRIIAEDLAADEESDFDYNDVVFDVAFTNDWVAELNANKLVAHITLQAAGGTVPLTVAGKEVHELFGVSTETMVNTNNGTVSKAPVQFNIILGDADSQNTHNADEIEVIAKGKKLEWRKGNPSEKLAVKTSYKWCDERQQIATKYPKFSEYVKDETVAWY